MTDFARDLEPDFCAVCGLPIQKWQATKYDGVVLSHLQCYDEDQSSKD